jgi:hypothetical protein
MEIIRTVPLHWHVQKFQFLAKVKETSTGKLLDSLPGNDAVLNSALVNSMWLTVVIQSVNYQQQHQFSCINKHVALVVNTITYQSECRNTQLDYIMAQAIGASCNYPVIITVNAI